MSSDWWPGAVLQFLLFLALIFGGLWLFFRYAIREVNRHLDELEEERERQEEERRAMERRDE